MSNVKGPSAVSVDEVGNSKVRVLLVIPGLKKNFFGKLSSNAKISVNFENSKLSVSVQLNKGSDQCAYQYQVNKLPGTIDPKLCHFKVLENKLELNLFKNPEESWAAKLSSNGLENE